MSHGILMNKFIATFDYNAINSDFDIFRISDSSEDYIKSNILDIPGSEFKALSVQYTYGKVAFVLFRKGMVTETNFRVVIQERFKGACVQKIDVTDAESRKSSYLYDNILIQLFANSIRVPKNDLFSYNNTTGKLYYLTPKWKRKNSFYCIEIKLEKSNIINLYVRSFRKKSDKDTSTGLIFDSVTGELRKKLSLDKNVTEYVQKGFSNAKNTVDFLRYKSYDDFYHSKLGILYQFLKDMSEEYGKYIMVTLEETKDTYDFEIPKSEKPQKLYPHYGKLLNNNINIVDEVKTKESEEIINKLIYELSTYYGVETTLGELSEERNNIRIIHAPDYYTDNDLPDPHNNISKDIIVQHMMIEESNHLELSPKDEKPSADIRKIVQELIIKRDIKYGRITCFDWESLGYDKVISFIYRETIKIEDDNESNKEEKEYLYKIMYVSPDGKTHFKSFDTRDFLNDEDLKIISIYEDMRKRYASYPNTLEGIMVTDDENYCAIVRTACTTMPNIKAIADSLEQKPFSSETLLDAILAFKAENPEYNDYANGVIEKLRYTNEISYISVNKCLDIKRNKKAGSALNGFIYANYGIRINPQIKNKANDEEYFLKNICNIRYFYENTWDNRKVLAYFVGTKRNNLKMSVHNACVIRKVYSDYTAPEPDKLLRLMSVEFVRNEQYTVIPFPFKYLREYPV